MMIIFKLKETFNLAPILPMVHISCITKTLYLCCTTPPPPPPITLPLILCYCSYDIAVSFIVNLFCMALPNLPLKNLYWFNVRPILMLHWSNIMLAVLRLLTTSYASHIKIVLLFLYIYDQLNMGRAILEYLLRSKAAFRKHC